MLTLPLFKTLVLIITTVGVTRSMRNDIDSLIKRYGRDTVFQTLKSLPHGDFVISYYGGSSVLSLAKENGLPVPIANRYIQSALYSATVCLSMPKINMESMVEDIKNEIGGCDAMVVSKFVETSSQLITARYFGRSQGWVRYRILISIRKLKKNPTFRDYMKIIDTTFRNGNYLQPVRTKYGKAAV